MVMPDSAPTRGPILAITVMAARSTGPAAASNSAISSGLGTVSFRVGLLSGLARVPRNGLSGSACRRSSQVQNAEQPDTRSRTVAGDTPFSASIKSLARAGASSTGAIPCREHHGSSRSSAAR